MACVERPDANLYGDEASALRRALPSEVGVWVGARQGASAAFSEVDLVLVDGGFQDPSWARTADLLVLDATASRWVMPAGPLREPLAAVTRADLVWLHRWDEPGAESFGLPVAVRSKVRAVELELPDGRRVPPSFLNGRPVVPISGIARPGSFHHTLRTLGAVLGPPLALADHHWFSPGDLRDLPTGLPVTTTKDRERLPSGFSVAVLHVDLDVEGLAAVDELLSW